MELLPEPGRGEEVERPAKLELEAQAGIRHPVAALLEVREIAEHGATLPGRRDNREVDGPSGLERRVRPLRDDARGKPGPRRAIVGAKGARRRGDRATRFEEGWAQRRMVTPHHVDGFVGAVRYRLLAPAHSSAEADDAARAEGSRDAVGRARGVRVVAAWGV